MSKIDKIPSIAPLPYYSPLPLGMKRLKSLRFFSFIAF
jgi:hypothetical protein